MTKTNGKGGRNGSTRSRDVSAGPRRLLADNKRQHLVIIRPNNPTGVGIDNHQLCSWAAALEADGCLVVGEAFIDLTPKQSLFNRDVITGNLIVTRSFGKFFGLAVIHLGFVFTQASLLHKLREKITMQQVGGPTQYVASLAISDIAWQARALNNIVSNARITEQLFAAMIQKFTMRLAANAQLFSSYALTAARALAFDDFFAKAGILTRMIQLGPDQAISRMSCVSSNNAADLSQAKSAVQQLCLLDDLSAVLNAAMAKLYDLFKDSSKLSKREGFGA